MADGGEIAVAMGRLAAYAPRAERARFLDSLRRYMAFRDSFRVPGGGIGVGWCLRDYGKRPAVPLAKVTRVLAPERNTYTIGCTLGAAYVYAALTDSAGARAAAARDADWLMPRCRRLTGAFAESFVFAHHLTDAPGRRRVYARYLRKAFVTPVTAGRSGWWLGGGGRSALDLAALVYCRETIADEPEVRARVMQAAVAMFSPDSKQSVYRVIANGEPTHDEWIYLCYGALGLAEAVRPMVTLDGAWKNTAAP